MCLMPGCWNNSPGTVPRKPFAALVQRHIALVHSVALRHTANAQHAQDITQAVFVILARKAGSLGRRTVLPGWLYHTARLTAANLQRDGNEPHPPRTGGVHAIPDRRIRQRRTLA